MSVGVKFDMLERDFFIDILTLFTFYTFPNFLIFSSQNNSLSDSFFYTKYFVLTFSNRRSLSSF